MIWRVLTYPLALLYNFITWWRNRAFDAGIKKGIAFDVPVISVGNLAVGGTGKTPHTEYLIRLLIQGYKVATLSRGYGRKTKGFLLATKQTAASDIGDEPLQMYQKFGHEVVVAVGEDRATAIPSILLEHPDREVILLDDAFQHRYVQPQLQILLTDFSAPFYQDLVMPAGLLRENRFGAKRADAVVVTKCPPKMNEDEKAEMTSKISRYTAPQVPVFFTGISYGEVKHVNGAAKVPSSVMALSGIAKPQRFEEQLGKRFEVKETVRFSDHHRYTMVDIRKIQENVTSSGAEAVVTTEKDWMRLQEAELLKGLENIPLFYLPIEVEFLEGQAEFQQMITEVVRNR